MGEDVRTIAQLVADQQPGFALEQSFYTDPDIYALELERVVGRIRWPPGIDG